MAKQQKTKRGFTLTELIIAVSLIIILSLISAPIYKNYRTNAIMAEGYALLSRIKQAQKSYYDEFGNFLFHLQASSPHFTCNEEVLGIDARSNRYFTSFCIHKEYCYDGRFKFYFAAYVEKPQAVRSVWNDNHLILQYNLTKGQRFCGGFDYLVDWGR